MDIGQMGVVQSMGRMVALVVEVVQIFLLITREVVHLDKGMMVLEENR